MHSLTRPRYEWTCTLCGATGTQPTIDGPTGWSDHYYRVHYTPPTK